MLVGGLPEQNSHGDRVWVALKLHHSVATALVLCIQYL